MSDRLFGVEDLDAAGSGEAGDVGPVGGARPDAPLAARMRPRNLDEFVGQHGAVGETTQLRRALERGEAPSLVLFGPPGSGKTSLARVIAAHVDAVWRELSAVTAGVRDVREVIAEARRRRGLDGRRTILFLDEIHRFNKAQQDALLPAVESGELVLVGATTENPFFELNAPLLSRCQLVRLDPLGTDDLVRILHGAVSAGRGLDGRVDLPAPMAEHLAALADGDARAALNLLELAAQAAQAEGRREVGPDDLDEAITRFRYDRAGDEHYDQISAFIKSLRGSDPDAAVYWLLRILRGGEDPRFLARRMVIFASEDVGLADDRALPLAVAAFEALDRVGLPEARFALVHAAVALAAAPKSNSLARALAAGERAVDDGGNAAVPGHLRDAHYRGAGRLGHGVGYRYPHDHPHDGDGGWVAQQYLPDRLADVRIYEPTTYGDEARVAERVERLRRSAARGRDARPDPDDGVDTTGRTT